MIRNADISLPFQIAVPALKERVATLTGVPPENQRLICRGKVLKDDHNLSSYSILSRTFINCVKFESKGSVSL